MKLFYVEHMVKYREKDEESGKVIEKEKLDTIAYFARSVEHLTERLAGKSWTPHRNSAGLFIGHDLAPDWDNVCHLRCA